MPSLFQSLQTRDLGHLRIVAGVWGVELASSETEAALQELAAALLEPGLLGEMVEALPADASSALEALAGAGGKIPWAAFARQFGELREAGPGRRDREQVHLNPISTAETLFYRALLARAFFDTSSGPQEFAYIPEDMLPLVSRRGDQLVAPTTLKPLGRLATPKERLHPLPATDRILDDATTFLTALRMGLEPPEMSVPAAVVTGLLQAAEILADLEPRPEAVRKFLEMPRRQALAMLGNAWQASQTFNELRLVPGLVCEGEWTNQPKGAREFLLHLLEAAPEGKWWSLPAFLRAIQEKHPDFQRPVGDYDSWFIKRASDGAYLRGYASWDEVDGALARYLITGPMFWLGRVELARVEAGGVVTAFRVNAKLAASDEKGKLSVVSNGRISVPRLVPRVTRYLLARFCEWEDGKPEEYRYRVTVQSLKKAGEQGLKVSQLLSLLAKNSAAEIPPAFVRALKRWEANGTEARVETRVVLRVGRPEVLEELRKSKAGRFLGESLGPVTVIVKPGAQSKVLAALAELGLLAEASTDSEAPKERGQADRRT